MEIYADVVLLINFVMNTFILWAIAKVYRQKVKYLQLSAGGLAMALMYVLTMIALPFSFLLSAFISLIMLSTGILIGCRPNNAKTFLSMMLVGFLCSLVIGGFGMMLIQRMPSVPLSLLLVCVCGSYILIKLTLRLIEGITIKKQTLCPVTIYVGEEKMSLQVLVDTGHTLCDPLNNSPVIIAEFDSIKELLPQNIRLMFYEQQENDLTGILSASTGSKFYERIRMIPFVSLGLTNGMLIGFRADRIALSLSQKNLTREDVVIGIYNKKLSSSGQYQGLIGPELVA